MLCAAPAQDMRKVHDRVQEATGLSANALQVDSNALVSFSDNFADFGVWFAETAETAMPIVTMGSNTRFKRQSRNNVIRFSISRQITLPITVAAHATYRACGCWKP